jgi:integrase
MLIWSRTASVRTRERSKRSLATTFNTFFFPVGDGISKIVADWVCHLREGLLWGNDDPLFPATQIALGATGQFEVLGLERAHWRTASPIRKIFREAFVHAGLSYFNPHSFRKTLAHIGQSLCRSPEELKAWSQNLGHEQVLTTFLSYGHVACQRQGEIIRALATSKQDVGLEADAFAEAAFKKLRDSGVGIQAAGLLPDAAS